MYEEKYSDKIKSVNADEIYVEMPLLNITTDSR